jgi:predicted ATPase/Tfp pilus assembly protein PilF
MADPPRTDSHEAPTGRAVRLTNLEPHATRFVGREADLSALATSVANHRLVTVLGPPGTGKTRVARELAGRQLAQGAAEGGVWFCDLTEATDADGICAAVARALGVSLTSAGSTKDTIIRLGHVLDARGELLLVLDNFEQVVKHAAATVGHWLGRTELARFLVASRQRLGVPGETLFDLGPLSLPSEGGRPEDSEAVQLFVDRARAVRRELVLGERDAQDVATLVRHLDGLPLAIELAAARMRVMSPAQILANLPRRFQLLSADRPGAGARQATLWSALEWSWDLLTECEQRALAQCSVFRGGFALEAAEEVLDLSSQPDAPWTLDVLQSLRDKSLLWTETLPASETRFALYASVRAYAADKLTELDLETQTLQRHAAHYLKLGRSLVRELDGARAGEAVERLRLELENLQAVFRRAVEDSARTGRFQVGSQGPVLPPARATQALQAALVMAALLSLEGPFGLCLSLLDTAIAAAAVIPRPGAPAPPPVPEGIDPALYARALEARGMVKRLLGRTAESLDDCERARAVAEGIGPGKVLAGVLGTIGWIVLMQGRPEIARERYHKALELHRQSGDRLNEARTLSAVGDTCFWFPDARPFLQEALRIQRDIGDRRGEAFTRCKLAVVELQEGRHSEAQAEGEEALEMARSIRDRRCEAVTLGTLALLDHDRGRLDEAEEGFERTLAIHRDIDNRWFEGIYLGYSGALSFEQGRLEQARARLERATRQHRDVGWTTYEGITLACLGAVRFWLGHEDAARSALDEADARLTPVARPELTAAARIARGHLEVVRAPDAARKLLDETATVAARSFDVRFARRMLAMVLERGATAFGSTPAPPPAAARREGAPAAQAVARPALVVCESGRWFQPPRGERVSLQRRRALHLIVKALADVRVSGPGTALSVDELLGHGWPGEKVHPEAGADRVYMALSTLRKLGLREVLLSRDDGYLLDPKVSIERAPE